MLRLLAFLFLFLLLPPMLGIYAYIAFTECIFHALFVVHFYLNLFLDINSYHHFNYAFRSPLFFLFFYSLVCLMCLFLEEFFVNGLQTKTKVEVKKEEITLKKMRSCGCFYSN